MVDRPNDAYLTPQKIENLITELKRCNNIWEGLIGGKVKGDDTCTRWHAPKLSERRPMLLDHIKTCMQDYVVIVQKRYPDLKHVRYNILKTAPNEPSQYAGSGTRRFLG